jgi:hypothetical protein
MHCAVNSITVIQLLTRLDSYEASVPEFTLTLYTYSGKNHCARAIAHHLRAVLVSDRTSRTVKYASTCPSLRAVTSGALWRVFPRRRYATLGFTLIELTLD